MKMIERKAYTAFGETGFGELGFGKTGFGEMGFGETGRHPLYSWAYFYCISAVIRCS